MSVGMSLVFNTHFYFSPTSRFQWGYSTLKSVEISSKISSTQGGGPALVRSTEGPSEPRCCWREKWSGGRTVQQVFSKKLPVFPHSDGSVPTLISGLPSSARRTCIGLNSVRRIWARSERSNLVECDSYSVSFLSVSTAVVCHAQRECARNATHGSTRGLEGRNVRSRTLWIQGITVSRLPRNDSSNGTRRGFRNRPVEKKSLSVLRHCILIHPSLVPRHEPKIGLKERLRNAKFKCDARVDSSRHKRSVGSQVE